MRTLWIWATGLVGSGLAGSVIAVGLVQPDRNTAFIAATAGFVSGVCGFTCWLLTKRNSGS